MGPTALPGLCPAVPLGYDYQDFQKGGKRLQPRPTRLLVSWRNRGDTLKAPTVRCILVNHRSPWDMLQACLDSIFSNRAGSACEVTLVDNASGDSVLEQVRKKYPRVRIIELENNLGFAAGVNRGLAEVTEPFVLLLNTDAVLGEGALAAMIAALEKAGDDCAGVAPKMMSSAYEGVIDAMGTVMPPDGASFNRGIGQCDLGQYDRTEEVFGTCFGATLLRTELFKPEQVGPLYEGYFLYFEDSDWCMRARSQGYRFLTVPAALVYHLHSGVMRHKTLAFKYRLIELNTLKIATRTFESPFLAARIVISRCARLLARTFIRRKFIGENLSTITSFLMALPGLIRERRRLKQRRIIADRKIFSFAAGEDAFFDSVAYRPKQCLDSLIASYRRLARTGRDGDAERILKSLNRLKPDSSGRINAATLEEVSAMLAGEPECVRSFIRQYIATI